MSDIVQRIKDKRAADGISVRGLAKLIGITFSGLAKIERGEHYPSEVVRAKLEQWLALGSDMPVSWRAKVDRRLDELERRRDLITHGESFVKVTWDPNGMNGLGEIVAERVGHDKVFLPVDTVSPSVTVKSPTQEEIPMAKTKVKRKVKKAIAKASIRRKKTIKGAKKPKPSKPKPPKGC